MTEINESRNPARIGIRNAVLRGILLLGALLVLADTAWLVWLAVEVVNGHAVTEGNWRQWALPVSVGIGGVFLALVLVLGAALIRLLASAPGRRSEVRQDDLRPGLERLEQSLRMLNSMQSRQESIRGTEGAGAAALNGTGRPLHVLEQVRDLALMNEDQRKRYAARHWMHRKRSHLEAIERDVLVGDWVSAFSRLEELEIVLPEDPQVIELKERVESEQNARLDEDLRAARGRLKQMMSAAMWQQAEELAAGLQQKYPGKADADRLADDVRRERENWERANMERLFRDISVSTEKRQWRHAVLAVEEFIRRYPLDPRAEALRLDLPTLQENAAAHERKEQEEHFKDLLKRQRYEEALVVARAVIQKYPHSPTATELNKLMPRVEELARQEAARAAANGGGAAQPAAQPASAGA